jgi:hypothetical protein
MTTRNTTFYQCECGAYRLGYRKDDSIVWCAGCRACDKIKMLEDGVRIRQGSDVTMDPENLLARAQREEAEVERLRAGIREALGELSFPAHAAVGDAIEVLKGLLGE